jgi:hypothetical protein
MTDADIDAAILRHLAADQPLSFAALCSRVQRDAGRRAIDMYRPVDRALQRLRKAGRIVPDRRVGWTLAVGSGGGGA